jgi:hypothetical protein
MQLLQESTACSPPFGVPYQVTRNPSCQQQGSSSNYNEVLINCLSN